MRGLSLVAASGGHSSSPCASLSLSRALLLRSTGSRRAGSVIVAHGPSCSAAYGIFPDRGSNPCPLHWQAGSQPLRHQGSPASVFMIQPQTPPTRWISTGLAKKFVRVFVPSYRKKPKRTFWPTQYIQNPRPEMWLQPTFKIICSLEFTSPNQMHGVVIQRSVHHHKLKARLGASVTDQHSKSHLSK